MEKLHTNAAPEGEGRTAVSPHTGTHGTAWLNRGVNAGHTGAAAPCPGLVGRSSAPTLLLGWLRGFSVRCLEFDPGRFGKPPAFLPSRRWGCKARSAWRQMEQQPSQTSRATPAEHGSQQADVKRIDGKFILEISSWVFPAPRISASKPVVPTYFLHDFVCCRHLWGERPAPWGAAGNCTGAGVGAASAWAPTPLPKCQPHSRAKC